MDILTRKVVRDGEILGYEVNTGGAPYYVCSSGLLSKELFKALMENGYGYFGRMEFEDGSGTNINYLPELLYETLDDYARADFFDVTDVMAEPELNEFIKKRDAGAVSEAAAFDWRKPELYLINTRDELLEHIKTYIVFDAADPKTYMPLNSFTNPDALFTEEEFDDPANYWAIDVIANRRYYNLHSLFKMTENLPISGFRPVDFIDAYFAWGIDGLKSSVKSKTMTEIEKPLYVYDKFPQTSYMNTGMVYVKKDMSMTPSLPPGWTTLNKEEQIYKQASELPGFGHGFLVTTKSPAACKCIRYELERTTVEITPDAMKFTTRRGEFLVKTLRFLMPSKLWNLTSEENKEEILHVLKIESMAKYLSGMLQCKSDVTSMKVYQTIGLTKPRAVDTILNIYRDILFSKDGTLKEEHRKFLLDDGAFDDSEISALSMQIGMIKDIYTFDDGTPENLEGLYNLCKKVEQGEINIDNVLNGIKADNALHLEDIIRHLDAAVKILGLSYEEIFNIIERDARVMTGEGTVTITFEGKELINELILHRQNFAALGFQKDLRSARSALAKGAQNWLYVREIYSEPGQTCARHMAVRLYSWPHHQAEKKNSFVFAIEEYIAKQITSQLAYLKIEIGDDIYQLIARCVCEFGLLGNTRASLTIKEGSVISVAVQPDLCKQINEAFERKYETTFNISNYMFKGTEPIFFCVNAIITPYWVVPLGRQLIPVYPLYIAWHYGKESSARAVYEDIKSKGHIPAASNFYSFKYLQTSFAEETQLLNTTLPGLSLAEYCVEYLTDSKNQKSKPLHPMDKYYSALSRADDEYLTKDDFSDGLKHKKLYYAAFGNSDAERSVIDVCTLDHTGELIDLYMGGKDRFAADSAIVVFKGFVDKDLLVFQDLDAFKEAYCAEMGRVYVKSFEQDTLFFTDGTEYAHYDLPAVDKGHYAVRKINERLYLAYYESGQVLRIDL